MVPLSLDRSQSIRGTKEISLTLAIRMTGLPLSLSSHKKGIGKIK